jgi:hypothetical protein
MRRDNGPALTYGCDGLAAGASMRCALVLVAVAIGSLVAVDFAEARKGGFVSALIRGGMRAGSSSTGPNGDGTSSTGPSSDGLGPVFRQKAYGPDVLTPAQLEHCVASAVVLDQRIAQLDEQSREVDREKAAIEAAQANLFADEAKVDLRSRTQVDSFNRRLAALHDRIDRYNADIRSYFAAAKAHNEKVDSYKSECTKKYYVEDMEALKIKLNPQW